jgi:hypothetical protein
MNSPKNHHPRVPGNRNPQTGAALIIVLASLIFVSVLTVAFLMSMRSKLALSKSGSDASEVKMLAETAVNIAISQVRDATKKSGTDNLAWASQPGMVRLYNASGNPAGYYKLYSADNMVATSGAFDPASDAVPAGWADDPAVFTDLNAPVPGNEPDPADPTKKNGIFPILDAAALTPQNTEWISLTNAPTTGTTNPAPMPVKWLYVLEDGSLHTPDASSSGTRAVISAATTTNPIVGRIAFWADDESTKININTASATSANTFWDVPRFTKGRLNSAGSAAEGDVALNIYQPAKNEFQRYPGHPATVSLNRDVLSDLSMDQIFALAPRVNKGGSDDATKTFYLAGQADSAADLAVTITPERLYATVDELVFDPDRQPQGLSRDRVRASGFFLTANSRAPELNLHGRPRVAMWPLSSINNNTHRTPADRLIAFCSTIGDVTDPAKNFPFYFTRGNRWDATADTTLDRNTALLNYLDDLTLNRPVPGFGGSFYGKYGDDQRQTLTQIFDYIRMTNMNDSTQPKPGRPTNLSPARRFAGNGGTRNLFSSQIIPARHEDWGTSAFGIMPRISGAMLHFVALADGDKPAPVLPNTDDLRKVKTAQVGTPVPPMLPDRQAPVGHRAVQAYLYFQFLNVSQIFAAYHPLFWVEVEGLNSFTLNGQNMGFPSSAIALSSNEVTQDFGVHKGASGYSNHRWLTAFRHLRLDKNTNDPATFPFYSDILAVPISAPTMAFSGGTLRVRFYAGIPPFTSEATARKGPLIQTLDIAFPPADFPLPTLSEARTVGVIPNPRPAADWNNPPYGTPLDTDRFASAGRNGWLGIDPVNDVAQSVNWVGEGSASHGDYRLAAGRPPEDVIRGFQPHPEYGKSRMAHALSNALGGQAGGGSGRGLLVDGATPTIDTSHGSALTKAPALPPGVTTIPGIGGDWDNGVGTQVIDGPYINFPDEGNIRYGGGGNNLSYFGIDGGAEVGETFFTPNRIIPSSAMLGSLPTGVKAGVPWRTLHFRPANPNNPLPPGPPDHTLLDLFWMPVVEPYAISEPFSTAGKINLNQQIIPFTYINRWAGLRALLASEKVTRIPLADSAKYKMSEAASATGSVNPGTYRNSLNLSPTDGTLRQFREKFAAGEIFRSGTEICDIFLVPEDRAWTSDAQARSQWYGSDFAMVGDNVRERPYANLYGRVTTKSNVFTVHYHAQVLQKSKARNLSDPTVFDTGAGDKVAAAQRGATTFERYLDPNDPRLAATDPAAANATSLEEFYRARIVNTSVFNP